MVPSRQANLSPYTTTSVTWQNGWPTDMLMALGKTQVILRVTLSYFIEPNPGERGGIDKYAYQSHALRFAARRPLESEAAFRGRINAQAAAEEQGLPVGGGAGDGGWTIGEKLRARGSLLSDSWTGTAVQLANRGATGDLSGDGLVA